MATGEWQLFLALPGIRMDEPIESGPVALVPPGDERMREMYAVAPNLVEFVQRFSDAFGVKTQPPMIIVRRDAPASYKSLEALAAFRNAISISTIAYNRALELVYPQGHRVMFGDAFAFYPWSLDRNDEHLVCQTTAMLALHVVDKFHGQPSASLSVGTLRMAWVDQMLLSGLLVRWKAAHDGREQEWNDIALFRSLNMAYHASLIPTARDTTVYDIGRIVALWVSAFEILGHPGGEDGWVNRDKVMDLIDQVHWYGDRCGSKSYKIVSQKQERARTLGSWLYLKLNESRNDFLHGNPVDVDSLRLPDSGRLLFRYPAVLYRMALAKFIDLEFKEPRPRDDSDRAILEAYYSRKRLSAYRKASMNKLFGPPLKQMRMRTTKRHSVGSCGSDLENWGQTPDYIAAPLLLGRFSGRAGVFGVRVILLFESNWAGADSPLALPRHASKKTGSERKIAGIWGQTRLSDRAATRGARPRRTCVAMRVRVTPRSVPRGAADRAQDRACARSPG